MQQRLTNLFNKDKLYAAAVVVFLIGLPILLVVTISNKEEKPAVTNAAIVEPVVEPVDEPEPVKPAPINLSGTGQTATEKFTLQSGLAVFKMTHSGSSNFIVVLLDSAGNEVDYSLVNEIGAFNGSKAVQIPDSGEYLLDIQAGGAWTVTIEQ